MILVAKKLTSDARRALNQLLRANKLNFSVRYIISLIFKNKCLVSNAKIPFNNYFEFNDHTILHSTKKRSEIGVMEPMKLLCEGDTTCLPLE